MDAEKTMTEMDIKELIEGLGSIESIMRATGNLEIDDAEVLSQTVEALQGLQLRREATATVAGMAKTIQQLEVDKRELVCEGLIRSLDHINHKGTIKILNMLIRKHGDTRWK